MARVSSYKEYKQMYSPGSTTYPEDIVLREKAILELQAVDATLVCLEGEIWLTRDGDQEDYIVSSGQTMSVAGRDKAVVQALGPSRIRLIGANIATCRVCALVKQCAAALGVPAGLQYP